MAHQVVCYRRKGTRYRLRSLSRLAPLLYRSIRPSTVSVRGLFPGKPPCLQSARRLRRTQVCTVRSPCSAGAPQLHTSFVVPFSGAVATTLTSFGPRPSPRGIAGGRRRHALQRSLGNAAQRGIPACEVCFVSSYRQTCGTPSASSADDSALPAGSWHPRLRGRVKRGCRPPAMTDLEYAGSNPPSQRDQRTPSGRSSSDCSLRSVGGAYPRSSSSATSATRSCSWAVSTWLCSSRAIRTRRTWLRHGRNGSTQPLPPRA